MIFEKVVAMLLLACLTIAIFCLFVAAILFLMWIVKEILR